MTSFSRNSLKRRLIWQLLLFQVVLLFLFVLALVALLVRADLGGALVDPEVTEIAARAMVRDENGHLRLDETEELKALRNAVPDFWFVARSDRGEVITVGDVPPVYQSMAKHLDRVSFADIRDMVQPYTYSAVIRKTSGPAGGFTVLGEGRLFSLTFVVLFLSNLLMIPILLILTLITIIAIPWIVTRAFSGLAVVAGQAEEIDIDRRGDRLPENNVPAEVRPLVHAVNGALQRLDAGYERHQRFILDAAHELRTPIAILQTRVETMPANPLRTRLLADTGRIAALAEQLLDLQRLDRDKASFKRVDLAVICKRVAADLAPLAIASGYELSVEAGVSGVFVMGDTGALERAVINLVQNAIEYGGQQGDITIRVERDGVIEVSDEGSGIPVSEREQVFEPFYRLHPRDHGAGLGLNLVKEIVSRHNGHVTIVDGISSGACFRITIPLAG
ncbi:HAMP domain-containing sensor histidine kinase [Phyllobacterium sp. YR531]|uniref:sensor histidine kinase n=1 Tax=Phyllobacterium sp. YR531 TaxID=1144343 RepID=UPI00026F4956|nr:HAMP domain-containing sensor histidine kinase [Phyllobacterium sp. YR531]EJN04940.1 signal transduction histidine kinase [Phyllobacterium sp. YR531]